MFSFLKKYFASDEARRLEPIHADQARKLEMDEPMAGAGAQLAGEHKPSETGRNLASGE